MVGRETLPPRVERVVGRVPTLVVVVERVILPNGQAPRFIVVAVTLKTRCGAMVGGHRTGGKGGGGDGGTGAMITGHST